MHQTKADVRGNILPWLQLGWTVVNVDYRLAGCRSGAGGGGGLPVRAALGRPKRPEVPNLTSSTW